MKNNVIMTDFIADGNWGFIKALEYHTGMKWTLCGKKTNHLHGSLLKNLMRVLCYIFYPFHLLISNNRHDNVIAWQQFFGLAYAFWKELFSMEKYGKLMVMTFIYNPKKGLMGKLYHQFFSFTVNSKHVDWIVCYSKSECEYYKELFKKSKEKFRYFPLGIGDFSMPQTEKATEKYIFSTGRSNRDYDFLINTLAGKKYKLIIACDSLSIGEDIGNIKIQKNCFGKDMLRLMANSFCVVITLKNTMISSGQLVALQAMKMGIPVIATKSAGIDDYIKDGETGLLINNKDSELMYALERLYNDTQLYNHISLTSKLAFQNNHTMDSLARNVGGILQNGSATAKTKMESKN